MFEKHEIELMEKIHDNENVFTGNEIYILTSILRKMRQINEKA